MKRLIILSVLVLSGIIGVNAQCPAMPTGFLCITQEAGNAARENKLELDATKLKVQVLEDALKSKDATIAENKKVADENEGKLKEALTKTQTELAVKTGQLTSAEGTIVRDAAIMDVLLKNTKKKCYPFSVCIN